MKHQLRALFAALMLVSATLACGLPSVSIPGVSDANGAVLKDNFDGLKQTWSTGTDANSSVEYFDGGLRFKLSKPKYFVWSGPNATTYSDVHVEVTAKNNSTDSKAAFGIICNQIVSSSYYYLAMTPAGEYAIARVAVAKDDLFLTNDDQWGTSDQIAVDAGSYQLGADCGGGTLTFYVDGKQIASVQDSTYEHGKVGLFAWSDEKGDGEDVTFDNFVVTSLK